MTNNQALVQFVLANCLEQDKEKFESLAKACGYRRVQGLEVKHRKDLTRTIQLRKSHYLGDALGTCDAWRQDSYRFMGIVIRTCRIVYGERAILCKDRVTGDSWLEVRPKS